MTWKQTQNSTNKNRRFTLGKKLLLSFFVGIVGLINVLPAIAVAQNIRGCQIHGSSTNLVTKDDVGVSRSVVGWDEELSINFKVFFNINSSNPDIAKAAKEMAEICGKQGNTAYKFIFGLYRQKNDSSPFGKTEMDAKFYSVTTDGQMVPGFVAGAKEYGYANGTRLTAKALAGNNEANKPGTQCTVDLDSSACLGGVKDPVDYYLYAVLEYNGSNPWYSNVQTLTYHSQNQNQQEKQLISVSEAVATGQNSKSADSVAFSDLSFAVRIGGNPNDKFKHFYRITFAENGLIAVADKPEAGREGREYKLMSFADFDKAKGVPIEMGLGTKSGNQKIVIGTTQVNYSSLANNYSTLAWLTSSYKILSSFSTLSVSDKAFKDPEVCGVSIFSTSQYFCQGGKVKESNEQTTGQIGTGDFVDFPFLLTQSVTLQNLGISDAKPTLHTVYVLPTIKLGTWSEFFKNVAISSIFPVQAGNAIYSKITNPAGFTYAAEPTMKLYFEVYPDRKSLAAAMNNAIPASVPEYKDVETANTESGGPDTVAGALFDFIRKVIAYLVILITSVIYWIFSTIVVPVLVALLSIKPYQDRFVDFIYPGWVIMRNLANIGFIIALLVMGLRILFQQDDAGKGRGFIVQLILWALLVNFSLVIAQSIVGVADTVQAQFLPAESKVIESLGAKLMVDPILAFRSSIADSSTNNFTAAGAAADIPKAIVLLLLALSAFIAFIAIAAFVLVRLIALWVLYMISPLAYVGRLLPQTKGYADQWWSEFIKYAMTVPVLVFFLNMAALVATTFSSRTGSSVTATPESSYFFGDLSGDLVTFVVTVVSHFIVLGFIFAGMQYAMKSGTFGSKEIVKYAKKGFDNLTSRPAKWAGRTGWGLTKAGVKAGIDAGADLATGKLDKAGYKKSAALVSLLAQPKIGGKALKEKFFDEPRKEMNKRLAGKRAGMEKFAGKVGENKWQATKMLAWKFAGEDKGYFLDKAKDMSKLMTPEEQDQARITRADVNRKIRDVRTRLADPDNQNVTKAQAEAYRSTLQSEISNLETEQKKQIGDLEKEKYQAVSLGETSKANALQAQIADVNRDYDTKLTAKLNDLDKVDDRLATVAKDAPGDTEIVMLTKDDANQVLEANSVELNADMAKVKGQLQDDQDVRSKYKLGNGPISSADREGFIREAENVAVKRDFPLPQAAARLAEEKEEAKKYDDIDDPEVLKVAFAEALKKNNVAAASALVKKLAKEGFLKDLMDQYGYANNIEDLRKFVDDKLSSMPVFVRNQFASEVSYISGQNGNRALMHATNIDENRVVRFNTITQQQEKLKTTAGKKPLWERSKGDLTYEYEKGRYKFNVGEIKSINEIDPSGKGMNTIKDRLKPDVAQHMLDAEDSHLIKDEIRGHLKDIAKRAVKS